MCLRHQMMTDLDRAIDREMFGVMDLPLRAIAAYLGTPEAMDRFWEIVETLKLSVVDDNIEDGRDADWLETMAHEIAKQRLTSQTK